MPSSYFFRYAYAIATGSSTLLSFYQERCLRERLPAAAAAESAVIKDEGGGDGEAGKGFLRSSSSAGGSAASVRVLSCEFEINVDALEQKIIASTAAAESGRSITISNETRT